jgi:uncharacterized coiled-coil protein SlyX
LKKTIPLIAVAICIILIAGFVGLITNYTSSISTKDDTLAAQQASIDDLNQQLTDQNNQLQQLNSTISALNQQLQDVQNQTTPQPTATPQIDNTANLNAQIATLQSQVAAQQATIDSLNGIINKAKDTQPTYVFHVCEKGDGYSWGRLPNAASTYNQILSLDNNKHNIWLLPEYKGHQNWTEELAWITSNFGGKNGIPIMLDVFGGGDGATPLPMLSTSQISQAMAVANVKSLRFAEVMSWYEEHSQTIPADYVANILAFCRSNNLQLFWTEWKTDGFPAIQNMTRGYDDIVTVSFSTNSNDLEPTDGFLYLKETFPQWGASIQAWYWTTHQNQDLMNMPPSLMLEQTSSAVSLGAKTIQFEPYWYLFDNGTPNNNLRTLLTSNA